MLAVFKREFKSYFTNVTGSLFVAVLLLFLGIYFNAYHLSYGYPYISYTVQSVLFISLILTPVLTMRSMADDRRTKTDQLLFTAPVSPMAVIFGKYMAMVFVFLIPVLVMSVLPLILGIYGSVPYAECYVAILAYFLFGCSCLAIGMLISTLTENLIIAAIGSIGVLLVCYVMSGIKEMISETGNWFTKALTAFDIMHPMKDMLQGILPVAGVLYYLSVIAVMLFLIYEIIMRRRFELSGQTVGASVFSASVSLVGIALIIGVNIAAAFIPEAYKSVDVTDNKLYEITDITKNMVGALEEDVTVFVLANKDDYDTTVLQTLSRYETLSKHLKFEYIDPKVNPEFAKKYDVDAAKEGSLIVVSDKRHKYIGYDELYESEFDYSTYSNNTTGYDCEGQLTSAIDFCISDEMPKLYIVKGHNEAELSDSFRSMLSKSNYDMTELNLLKEDAVPEDAAAIIIDAPVADFSKEDAAKVKAYIDKGGKALIISSYSPQKLKNFDSIMEAYGVSLVPGVIVEQNTDNYYQAPYFLLPQIKNDPVTAELLRRDRLVLMPYAQGAKVKEVLPEGVSVSEILVTSGEAFARVDFENNTDFKKSASDEMGPFSVGLSVQKQCGDETAKILYFTSEAIIADNVDSMTAGSNTLMVSAGVAQMAAGKESSVSIPVKSFDRENITVNRTTAVILALLLAGVVPLIVFISGLVVWISRRKR